MKNYKSLFYSIGIACFISAPISHAAMQSWDSPPRVQYSYMRTVQDDAIRSIDQLAEQEAKRATLIMAEKMRQQQILTDAEYTLASYEVELPQDIKRYCDEAGREFDICPELLEAICWRESRFDCKAENEGCSGLMQVSTKWHGQRMVDLGVSDIYDAEGNIRVGASYLAELFNKHGDDLEKVLKEYNGDTSKGVSAYVVEILEVSEALERIHGK